DLPPAHPQHAAVEEHVLAAGQLRVEAGPDFEQAAEPAADLRPPRRRLHDPREDLQERALAGPVAADDPDHLARLHLEAHLPQRPELAGGRGWGAAATAGQP